MSLVSLEFLVFILIVAIIYFVLPGKVQWIFLLVASSVFFCLNSSVVQVWNLAIFLAINFVLSLIMSKQTDRRKLVFVCVVIFDITYLLIFKYFSFFMPILGVCGISNPKLSRINEALIELAPMGISYMALIVIGYMAELYWEHIEVQKNVGKFALFSIFFPQIVSGPIVKYQEYDGYLWGEKHTFSYDRVVSGIERTIWGVFKKLVISSRAGIVANTIYDNYHVYTGFYIPVGIVFYIIQLYCDFSGLMDIVIGVSEILGTKMPENFNTPFYSETMAEFWRRWHITLGRFLKEYILFPMQTSGWFRKLRKAYKKAVGKSFEKKFNLPRYFTMLISWTFIGFWHGGGWNYIWGVGIYMWIVTTLGEILEPVFNKLIGALKINTDCFSWILFRRARTFALYMFGVSFFWARSIKDGFALWKNAFASFNPWIFVDKSLYSLGLSREEMMILGVSIILLFVVSHIKQKKSAREALNEQNYIFRVAVYMVLIAMTVVWGHYGSGFDAASFIYGKF